MELITNLLTNTTPSKGGDKYWRVDKLSLLATLRHIRTPWVLWTSRPESWAMRNAEGLNQWLGTLRNHMNCVGVYGNIPLRNNLWNDVLDGNVQPILWRTSELIEQLLSDTDCLPCTDYAVDNLTYQVIIDKSIEVIDANRFGLFPLRSIRKPTVQERRLVAPVLSSHRKLGSILCMTPEVTVVIAAFNEENHIGWAIRSLITQTQTNWELIMVDDGSSDATTLAVESFQDPRIQIFRNPINRGKANSLNLALKHARSPFVLELDADDWLPPQTVAEFTNEMKSLNPDTALLTAHYYLWRQTQYFSLCYCGIRFQPDFVVTPTQANPIIPRFYRTDALQTVGGWPELPGKYGRLYEDIAVCLRLRAKYQIARTEKALYHRVIRSKSVSQSNRNMYGEWHRVHTDESQPELPESTFHPTTH